LQETCHLPFKWDVQDRVVASSLLVAQVFHLLAEVGLARFGLIDRINLDSIGFGVVAPTIARIHRHLVRRYSRSPQAHSRAYGQ
jgi:hypothetical protein